MAERTNHFHFLLSDKEQQRLRDLANRAETKQSDYLRALIKREWEADPTLESRPLTKTERDLLGIK